MNTALSIIDNECPKIIPNLPSKRRLSSSCWERIWSIQFEEPLNNPHAIHELAANWSNDATEIVFQLRTPTKICLVVRTTDCSDQDFIELSIDIFKSVENAIGAIHKIDDKAATWRL